jgi:CheY-like chemotaxis protein
MNVTRTQVLAKKRRRSTILVVEDNADQWFIIKWALERQFSEVDPIWAANATDALLYLESCNNNIHELPRLVLLDLYLPTRETGWHLLQHIKTHYIYREIPVITLSASMDQEDITESYMLRSNSYIIKPSSLDKWTECMSAFRHYWWDAVTLPKLA